MEFITEYSNIIGMIGVTLTLVAYYLLNINKFASTDVAYLILNFIGSTLVLVSLMVNWNLSSVVIEAAWVMISILGLVRVLRARRKKTLDLETSDV